MVYHYISARYGLEGIQKRRLKISRIMELNDPFEFLGVNLKDRKFRKLISETKQELSKSKGLLCFSKTWRNPVLWGHYADKHKGLCLGFEIASNLLGKVEYIDSRLPVPTVVGDQSSVTRAELADALGNLNNSVESFKARAGFQEFEVVRQQNSAKWA